MVLGVFCAIIFCAIFLLFKKKVEIYHFSLRSIFICVLFLALTVMVTILYIPKPENAIQNYVKLSEENMIEENTSTQNGKNDGEAKPDENKVVTGIDRFEDSNVSKRGCYEK